MSNTVLEIVRLGMLVNKELIDEDTEITTNRLNLYVYTATRFFLCKIDGSEDHLLLEILAYLRNLLGDKYIDSPI